MKEEAVSTARVVFLHVDLHVHCSVFRCKHIDLVFLPAHPRLCTGALENNFKHRITHNLMSQRKSSSKGTIHSQQNKRILYTAEQYLLDIPVHNTDKYEALGFSYLSFWHIFLQLQKMQSLLHSHKQSKPIIAKFP